MEHAGEPESRKGTVYGVMGTLVPLAIIAVSLRFYSRLRFTYVGIDDILILLALVCLT